MSFYVFTGFGGNEIEATEKAVIHKSESIAVNEACKAKPTLQATPGSNYRTFDSTEISAEGLVFCVCCDPASGRNIARASLHCLSGCHVSSECCNLASDGSCWTNAFVDIFDVFFFCCCCFFGGLCLYLANSLLAAS